MSAITKTQIIAIFIFSVKLAAHAKHDKTQSKTSCKRIWLSIDTVFSLRTRRPTYTFCTLSLSICLL